MAKDASDDLVAPARRSLQTMLPIVHWLPRYRWGRTLPSDLVAGIAVAALLIPESMGYAGVAGVPTQVGLYAALAAVFAYAVTGGTSILVVGPAASVGSGDQPVAAGEDPAPDEQAPGGRALTGGLLRCLLNQVERTALIRTPAPKPMISPITRRLRWNQIAISEPITSEEAPNVPQPKDSSISSLAHCYLDGPARAYVTGSDLAGLPGSCRRASARLCWYGVQSDRFDL